jgi:uncharacterized protein YybS (DUF2232 family)
LSGRETRSLTEGAMLAAITVLLSLLGAYIFPYIFFIVPVPLTILVYRHGLRQGIVVAVATSLLAGLVIHVFTTLILLLVLGLVGIAIGVALREGLSASRVMLIGSIAAVIAYVLLVVFSQALFEVNILDMMVESFELSIEQVTALYQRMGMAPEQLEETRAMLFDMIELMKIVLPVTLLLSAIALAFVNFLLSRLILQRLGSTVSWFPPFAYWRFPWYLAWGYILGMGLPLLFHQGPMMVLASNLQIFFTYVFLIQGLAIIWFFFEKHKIHRLGRTLFLILVFFPRTAFSLFVIWGGVLDTWFDFRKIENQ